MTGGFFRLLRIIDDKFFGGFTLDLDIFRSFSVDPEKLKKQPLIIYEKRGRQILVPSFGQNGDHARKTLTLEFQYKGKLNSKWRSGQVPHKIYPVFQNPPTLAVDSSNALCVPVVSRVSRSSAEIVIFYNYSVHDLKQVQAFNNHDIEVSITIQGKFKAQSRLEKLWQFTYRLGVFFGLALTIYAAGRFIAQEVPWTSITSLFLGSALLAGAIHWFDGFYNELGL